MAKQIDSNSKWLDTAFSIPNSVVKLLQDGENATSLYKHQIEAVLATKDYLDQYPDQPAIVVLPTGCGKTGVAVVASYALNVGRVLIITPSAAISEQIHEEFVGIRGKKKTFMVERGLLSYENINYVPTCGIIKHANEIAKNLQNALLIVNAHKLTDDILQHIPREYYDLVIVDEAHHYPAVTWKIPTDHFVRKKIFLTATPYNQGERVLTESHISHELTKDHAIQRGIIRKLIFDDQFEWLINYNNTEINLKDMAHDPTLKDLLIHILMCQRISDTLDAHDREDTSVKHQAMVLVHLTKEAEDFATAYNNMFGTVSNSAKTYYGATKPIVVDEFRNNDFRVLVVTGKLIEGFDHKPVSVVAIARNVSQKSRVLFAQFVGRAVRRVHFEEKIDAVLISHPCYKQRENFEEFYDIATNVDHQRHQAKKRKQSSYPENENQQTQANQQIQEDSQQIQDKNQQIQDGDQSMDIDQQIPDGSQNNQDNKQINERDEMVQTKLDKNKTEEKIVMKEGGIQFDMLQGAGVTTAGKQVFHIQRDSPHSFNWEQYGFKLYTHLKEHSSSRLTLVK